MSHTSLIPGSTTGTAVPTGYIGEIKGAAVSVTDGAYYVTEDTTAINTNTTVCSISGVKKGTYILMANVRGVNAQAAATKERIDVQILIGGTALTGIFTGTPCASVLNETTVTSFSVPINIFNDATVALQASLVYTLNNLNNCVSRLSLIRIV